MLESSSTADFEGANSEQKRIKLEEQQLVQTQGKVSWLKMPQTNNQIRHLIRVPGIFLS